MELRLVLHNEGQEARQKLFCHTFLCFHSFLREKPLTVTVINLRPFPPVSAAVLFPCGVGRVASRLLSKFVGLYRKVIYVRGL